jgi:hypothetical protein
MYGKFNENEQRGDVLLQSTTLAERQLERTLLKDVRRQSRLQKDDQNEPLLEVNHKPRTSSRHFGVICTRKQRASTQVTNSQLRDDQDQDRC